MPLHPASRKHVEETGVPFIFSIIKLDEGIRIFSEVVGSKYEELKIGVQVKVSFEEVNGTNFKLPKFRLIKSEG